ARGDKDDQGPLACCSGPGRGRQWRPGLVAHPLNGPGPPAGPGRGPSADRPGEVLARVQHRGGRSPVGRPAGGPPSRGRARGAQAPLRVAPGQGAGDRCRPAPAPPRLTERARTAASAGAHLLIGPEMSLTGYNIGDAVSRSAEPADGPLSEAVAGIAAATGVAIVYGFPERAGEHVYNTVQLVDGHGRSLARYRKT